MIKRPSDDDLSRDSGDWSFREVKHQELGPFQSIRQILGPREWPASESLNDVELIA
jgi:hypothetical protein